MPQTDSATDSAPKNSETPAPFNWGRFSKETLCRWLSQIDTHIPEAVMIRAKADLISIQDQVRCDKLQATLDNTQKRLKAHLEAQQKRQAKLRQMLLDLDVEPPEDEDS